MTPAERANLEYVYDRLYRLYERGDIRPGEMQELQRLDGLLRPMWDAEQAQYEYETQPRIMAREPTVVESLTDWMSPGIESVTGLSPRSSTGIARDVAGLLDFTPVIGGGISMAQAARDARRGDYGSAAVNAGLGMLDLLPLKIPKAKTKTLTEGMVDAAGAAPDSRIMAAISAARPTGTARGLLSELAADDYNGAVNATERLRQAGVPGIKYLDAWSRGVGDGSRNYVIFDENLINVVRKYGTAGAAAALGVSQADVAQAMEQQQPQGLLLTGVQ